MNDTKVIRQLQGQQPTPSVQVCGGNFECNNCQFANSSTATFVCDNGKLVTNKTEYKDNKIHLEVTRHAEAVCKTCQFLNSTGNYAVKVSEDAKATLESCEVTGSSNVGLVVDAEINVLNCKIKDSRKIGVLCSGTLNKLINKFQIMK